MQHSSQPSAQHVWQPEMVFGGFTPFTLIDYPGKTAAMVYTIGCNFRCPYCHNPELVDETVEQTYTEAEIVSFLAERVGLLDGVVITGGEPTMHGDKLLRFMRKVQALGFLVKLDSNGTDPAFLREAIDGGLVDYIAMDIKAPLRRYQAVVGRPVSTDAIRESIELLKRGRVPYEFRTTVVKALLSPEDIAEMAQEINGAKSYYLQQFVPSKILNPQFKRKVSYTTEEFAALQRIAAPHVGLCGIR